MKLPEIPLGLISALEQLFPDRAPRHSDGGLFAFGERAGEQRVLDLLRLHYNKQQQPAYVPREA
jgi:hypothetical protein